MTNCFAYDEVVYRGKVATVHRVGLRMRDGEVVPRDFIHHSGAAVVLPVLENGDIVLIRNYRFAVDEHLLELPAGILEDGENPLACAARELKEETGYTAGQIEQLCWFYSTPGCTDEVIHAYLATRLTDGAQKLDRYEDITVEILPDDEARKMVFDGRIHDGKTVAALATYWLTKGA